MKNRNLAMVTPLRATGRPEPPARRDVGEAELIGCSLVMDELRAQIDRLADSDRPVLVLGPTGSGKELVVGALHRFGSRAQLPLIDVDCTALPDSLAESELFGHEKGAFTGADHPRAGYFEGAGEGTLFLDEIGDLPLTMQAKLLRVLETQRFRPVGSIEARPFQARVVAATHVDLEERVRQGTFRRDLYYRLNVLVVNVPSLESRREDIPLIVEHFARRQWRSIAFTAAAMAKLTNVSWPGNVRQLRNFVDRAADTASRDLIDVADVDRLLDREQRSMAVEKNSPSLDQIASTILDVAAGSALSAIQQALVRKAMHRARDNKTAAAKLLGVHRKVVERKIAAIE